MLYCVEIHLMIRNKFREINFIYMDYLDPLVHVLNEFIFQALQENRFHSVL